MALLSALKPDLTRIYVLLDVEAEKIGSAEGPSSLDFDAGSQVQWVARVFLIPKKQMHTEIKRLLQLRFGGCCGYC